MGVFGKVVDYVGCNSKLVDAAEFESDIRSSDPRLLEAGANVATVGNVQICFEFTYVGTLGTHLQMRKSSLPSRIVVGRAVTRRECPRLCACLSCSNSSSALTHTIKTTQDVHKQAISDQR